MGMVFNYFSHFPDLWVWFSENSPDLWVVLLRFEWHNPVSWKLKLPPPPGQRSRLNAGRNFSSQRIVESRNELPEEIVNCMTVLHFEKLYDSFHCKFKYNSHGSLGCKRRFLLLNIVIIFIIVSSYFAVPFFDGLPPPLRLPSGASGFRSQITSISKSKM